jgi:putative ABC transport system permease protein
LIPVEYNIRSLILRPGAALAAVGTLAVAVFVYACSHMLVLAVRASEGRTGDDRIVVFTSRGSSAEGTSRINEAEMRALDFYDELVPLDTVARGAPELVVDVRVGRHASVRLRGVTPRSFVLRPNVQVIAGRGLDFGRSEVLIGRVAKRILQSQGALKGAELQLQGTHTFAAVGEMRARNSTFDTEVWMDLQTLRAFFADASSTSAYAATLATASSLDAVRAHLERDRNLALAVSSEAELYGGRTEGLSLLLRGITVVVASVLVLGSFFGAMTALFALVRGRSKEIGTLKALGFERGDILRAYLIEAFVISLLAFGIGMGGASLMSVVHFEALAADNEVMGLGFEASAQVVVSALAVALGLGFAGGFLPALVASRVSPMEAIRAL